MRILRAFCSALEDWDACVQEGYAALAVVQRQLAQLQPDVAGTDRHQGVADIHVKLLGMAPSVRLEQYIARQGPSQQPDPTQAARLQAGYLQLQRCIADAQEVSAKLMRLAKQQTTAALSEALVASTGSLDAANSHLTTPSHAVNEQQLQALPPAPEEVALLMSAVASGIGRDAAWMAELRAAITIATPAEDLESYMTVWELQPFTDEDAVAALLEINSGDVSS